MDTKTNNGMDPNQGAPGMDSDNNKKPNPDEILDPTGNPPYKSDEQTRR